METGFAGNYAERRAGCWSAEYLLLNSACRQSPMLNAHTGSGDNAALVC